MSAEEHTAMDAEFDDVAAWTLDAVARLGRDHAVPAACRGSASPAALDWLGEACHLGDRTVLVDVGGGMGGPAAYAAGRFGARPVVVEPLFGPCRTARGLFGFPVLRASGERLPIRTASAPVVWCLGVLCTVAGKAPVLAELRRVLRPGGTLGLLVLVAEQAGQAPQPEGNHFPTRSELAAHLDGAGFAGAGEIEAGDLPGAPADWRQRIDRVDVAVAGAHAGDPRLEQARAQEAAMHRLLASGQVSTVLMCAVGR